MQQREPKTYDRDSELHASCWRTPGKSVFRSQASREAELSAKSLNSKALAAAPNVVEFRLRVATRHREHLARWLKAGHRMGLHDADASHPDQVVIWVRENPDPAYLIEADGRHWVVNDCIRGDRPLGRYRTFEEALHSIRPVLTPDALRAG